MLRLLLVTLAIAGVAVSPAAAGTFSSSDPQLNAIWVTAVKTAHDMLAPGGQTFDALGRYCPTPAGQTVILDGVVRDRCPYIGDESVTDLTLDASTPRFDVQKNMLRLFTAGQAADGAIPSSPFFGGVVLPDYCGYWVVTLHNYVLYSGDVGYARTVWPNLVKLLDGWYLDQMGPDGLLVDHYGHSDYGFIRRRGDVVAYLNAQYGYVLRQAAELAGWLGKTGVQQKWLARADLLRRPFQVFWDPTAGAFTDTTVDRLTHPEDGNVFAVLGGLASQDQARSSLGYLSTHESYSYGNSVSDSQVWDDAAWGLGSNLRVYPFIGFYDLLARYAAGEDASALNMIRREWGYMTTYGPQPAADWEVIGPYGGGPTDQHQSWDAGWSSGGGPALTEYVLGIRPRSPGFATFVVSPHADGVAWARGSVDTPHGRITVSWHMNAARKLVLSVKAPAGTRRVWGAPRPALLARP